MSDEILLRAHQEILKGRGIIAYVDVWQDDILNYTVLWQEKLTDMGATVVKRWSPKVTHLVFKDGRPEYMKRALIQKCTITGITWILDMEEQGKFLDEKNYPCINKYSEVELNTPKRMKNIASDVHTPEEKRIRAILKLRRQNTPTRTPLRNVLFQNTPDNTPVRNVKQAHILAPNTQVPPHRKRSEITVIPDTPDRDPDSQHDIRDVSLHCVPETPSPVSQALLPSNRYLRDEKDRNPFDFSFSRSLSQTSDLSTLTYNDMTSTTRKDEIVSQNSPVQLSPTKKKKVEQKNRRKSYLIESKSKIKRKSSVRQILKDLDRHEKAESNTPELCNMFEETLDHKNKNSQIPDFSFESPERTKNSQTQLSTISMIADSPAPVSSILMTSQLTQDLPKKKTKPTKDHIDNNLESSGLERLKEITDKTNTMTIKPKSGVRSQIVGKSRRRTRLSLDKYLTPERINYGYVGMSAGSYVLVNFKVSERTQLNNAIHKLSNGCKDFKLVQNAKCHTTHCFVKGKAKTVQVLRSLAYGAYILSDEYIHDSIAAGKWLNPEEFEMDSFASQKVRKNNNPKLFNERTFFVCPDTKPKRVILEELIEFCGGGCSRKITNADFIIGASVMCEGLPNFGENWIVDSIESAELQFSDKYNLSISQLSDTFLI